jgi:carbamate kinase
MYIYTSRMNEPITPQSLIEQILQIKHMEHGSLCAVGHGPAGPYFNLNSWENNQNCCRYVPRDKVAAVQQAIEGYHKYQQLTEQYARQVIEKTRAELGVGVKKNATPHQRRRRPESSWRKKPRSNS